MNALRSMYHDTAFLLLLAAILASSFFFGDKGVAWTLVIGLAYALFFRGKDAPIRIFRPRTQAVNPANFPLFYTVTSPLFTRTWYVYLLRAVGITISLPGRRTKKVL